MPKVLVFAGPNGSGKTTLANSVVKTGSRFINADAIMDKEHLNSIEAGKKTIQLIDSCIAKGVDFSFETTMSGLVLQKKFKLLKQKRYQMIIFFLFVYPVGLLAERIKERIKKGGHPVAEEDIVRRYSRSISNFWNIYRYYSAEWAVINNNEFRYKYIAIGSEAKYQIIDEADFLKFKEVLHDKG